MEINGDYEPFGFEWRAEMQKWRKQDLIEYLAKVLKQLKEENKRVQNLEHDKGKHRNKRQRVHT